MKKLLSKAVSAVLSVTLLVTSCVVMPSAVYAAELTVAGGWNETLYAQWQDSNPQLASVSYKLSTDSSYTTLQGEDKEFLQRSVNGTARVDIPGVPAGTYDIKIVTADGVEYEKKGISVDEIDRSGFAHFNYTDGVGGYNDNGTLKANAKVLYVTEQNKNTVTVSSSDGTTVSGIGNILNSAGSKPRTNNKGNVVSNVINTNKDIIRKLAEDGTPLVVRFIGSVSAPEGLTAYDSYDYGGTPGDNGFMARIQSGKDITIEGIGYDAEIKGWGMHFIAQSSNPQFGKSVEFKNLTFWGAPEDAVGMEGQQSGSTLTVPVERCWVHNCTFAPQVIANPAESDKSEGDGCCDFKRGQYMTMSYNKFLNAHKTNLVGSSDTSLQYHITWHHNMWENCEARGPLGRQANMHIYNNYYKSQSSYAMNPRANCYIFSEYNTMEYCKNPMTIKSGAIKSFNDTIMCCGGDIVRTVVHSRDQKVNSANIYAGFEMDGTLSYIPSGNYKIQENAAEAKATCMAQSGVMKETILDPSEIDTSVISADFMPTAPVELPFNATFGKQAVNAPTTTGKTTVENVVYNPTKIGSSDMTVKDSGIVFTVDKRAKVTLNGISGSYNPGLFDKNGNELIKISGTVIVEPGTYMVQSSGFDAGKQQYKEAKVTALSVVEAAEGETIETTTEEQSEATTSAPAEMGVYVIGKTATGGDFNVNEKATVVGNIRFSINSMSNDYCGLKADGESEISFTVDRPVKLTLEFTKKKINVTNDETFEYVTLDPGAGAIELEAGSYTIAGAEGSNANLSKIILEANGEKQSTSETSTETTSETVTDDSSETTTETSSETTTETSSETTTSTLPVEMGTPTAGGVADNQTTAETDVNKVIYQPETDDYLLYDTSSTYATYWNIPFETLKDGEYIITGRVTPTKAAGKWAFVQLRNGETEVVALSADSNKNLALRINGKEFVSFNVPIEANKTYEYELKLTLSGEGNSVDAKIVDLLSKSSADATAVFTADSVDNIYMMTAKSATDRNLVATMPYVGMLKQYQTPQPTRVWGDFNNDTVLDASDSANILQYVLNKSGIEYDEETEKYINVDGDAEITAADSSMVLQKVLLSTFELPVERIK